MDKLKDLIRKPTPEEVKIYQLINKPFSIGLVSPANNVYKRITRIKNK